MLITALAAKSVKMVDVAPADSFAPTVVPADGIKVNFVVALTVVGDTLVLVYDTVAGDVVVS